MIARTIPKIIPPTKEAPSNFLPLVGAGVGCFKGTSVTVGVGVELVPVVVTVVDMVGAGVVFVGDIVVDAAVFVLIEPADAEASVSLEATERTNQI